MSTQKDALRAEARRARSKMSLSAEEHKVFVDLFLKHISPKEGDIVAVYWPIEREFDTHMLAEELWALGVQVALPVMDANTRFMRFVRYDQKTDLEKWKHGILQPVIQNDGDIVIPNVVIVPLLAFDRRGHRLGYGGGYYDSTLQNLKDHNQITTVGVGYAQQACLFNLPAEEHDVCLDWVITEQSAQNFKEDK